MKAMLIRVKVFPNSKKDEIKMKREDSFEILVKEKAEGGRANEKVLEILSSYFKIPKNKFMLIRGGKQRNKIFEIK